MTSILEASPARRGRQVTGDGAGDGRLGRKAPGFAQQTADPVAADGAIAQSTQNHWRVPAQTPDNAALPSGKLYDGADRRGLIL